MKRTITQSDFIDAFRDYGREDQFSYEALCALFEFFDEYDECAGTETELDVIAICCDFYESDIDEVADNYGITEDIEEYLNENTLLVGVTDAGNYVYQAF